MQELKFEQVEDVNGGADGPIGAAIGAAVGAISSAVSGGDLGDIAAAGALGAVSGFTGVLAGQQVAKAGVAFFGSLSTAYGVTAGVAGQP